MVYGFLTFTSKKISKQASKYLSQSIRTYVKTWREHHITLDVTEENYGYVFVFWVFMFKAIGVSVRMGEVMYGDKCYGYAM